MSDGSTIISKVSLPGGYATEGRFKVCSGKSLAGNDERPSCTTTGCTVSYSYSRKWNYSGSGLS